MTDTWGFLIPGLAMLSDEFPRIYGLHVLQNPEIGNGVRFEKQYTLEEVAVHHLETIRRLADYSKTLTVYGFSMGGMILAILATKYRAELPPDAKFVFLMTSANTKEFPAIPDRLFNKWMSVDSTNRNQFIKILGPFFSESYRVVNAAEFNAYVDYRLSGGNQQSPRAFVRQLIALKRFNGEKYFSSLNGRESVFVNGSADEVLNRQHGKVLTKLVPSAKHITVPNGHMMFREVELSQLIEFLNKFRK